MNCVQGEDDLCRVFDGCDTGCDTRSRYARYVHDILSFTYNLGPSLIKSDVYDAMIVLTLKHLQNYGVQKNMSNKVAFLSWKMCESCKIFD